MPGRREERSVFFSDSRGRVMGLGTSREALSKGIPLAQARLQMQIGHARATSKGIPLAQARLQMQIGHARQTRRTFTFLDRRGVGTDLGVSEKL